MRHTPFLNQVVLITGASSGIGRALAMNLAHQGAHLVLVARNLDKLRGVERLLPGQHLILPGDVTDPAAINNIVNEALRKFGHIDVLINNAGIGHCGTVLDTTSEEFRTVFETNFFAPLHLLHVLVPRMIERRSGLIIQISSVNGFCSVPLGSAYCASKFALEGLSQAARLELRQHDIHLLIVRPGVTDTEFFDHSKNFRSQNPFPLRHLMPAEVAAAQIVQAAARRKREITLTTEGKLLWWLKKLSPALVDRILMHYVKEHPTAASLK